MSHAFVWVRSPVCACVLSHVCAWVMSHGTSIHHALIEFPSLSLSLSLSLSQCSSTQNYTKAHGLVQIFESQLASHFLTLKQMIIKPTFEKFWKLMRPPCLAVPLAEVSLKIQHYSHFINEIERRAYFWEFTPADTEVHLATPFTEEILKSQLYIHCVYQNERRVDFWEFTQVDAKALWRHAFALAHPLPKKLHTLHWRNCQTSALYLLCTLEWEAGRLLRIFTSWRQSAPRHTL